MLLLAIGSHKFIISLCIGQQLVTNKVNRWLIAVYIATFSLTTIIGAAAGMYQMTIKTQQDGPSLESSSYLNVTLRYFGPLDTWTLGPSSISYYLLVCYGLEWWGCQMTMVLSEF